jgi:aspartate kinase
MTSATVVKLGGSVLTDPGAYRRAAGFVASLISTARTRIVAVVSAEFGHTDRLLDEARRFHARPDPGALDLLWATGELRSVALLTFALHSAGVSATGLNVHETGLRVFRRASPRRDRVDFNTIELRAALERAAVVVVPGFLATAGPRMVTLGRGGSDCSAVLLAAALGADRCVLVKDVDGYYTSDPREDASATLLSALTYGEAIAMADAGCPLVQRQAIVEARDRGIELVVRSFESRGTEMTGTAGFVVDALLTVEKSLTKPEVLNV